MDCQVYVYFAIPSLVNQSKHCREVLKALARDGEMGKEISCFVKVHNRLKRPYSGLVLVCHRVGTTLPSLCNSQRPATTFFPVAYVLSEPVTSITGSLKAYEICCFLNQFPRNVRQLK